MGISPARATERRERATRTQNIFWKISLMTVHFCPSIFGLSMGTNVKKRGCKGLAGRLRLCPCLCLNQNSKKRERLLFSGSEQQTKSELTSNFQRRPETEFQPGSTNYQHIVWALNWPKKQPIGERTMPPVQSLSMIYYFQFAQLSLLHHLSSFIKKSKAEDQLACLAFYFHLAN